MTDCRSGRTANVWTENPVFGIVPGVFLLDEPIVTSFIAIQDAAAGRSK